MTRVDDGGRRKRRFPKWLRWTLIGMAAFTGLWLLAAAGNTIGRYVGWTVAGEDPLALAERLRPFYRVMKPEGAGPFPTGLLYSGCDGPKDNLERWGEMLNARGWAALIVDSYGPRGYLDYDIWRLTCAGQLFMGSERAADVLVSLYDARRMPFVDGSRMVLIGSSHGGWAVMELLAFEAASELPYGLAALPDDMVEKSAGRRRRNDPGLSLLRQRQPVAPLRLASSRAGPVPAQRRRHDHAVGRLPGGGGDAHAARPAGGNGGLRRRDPRLRPDGACGAKPARVRCGGDRGGPSCRRRIPGSDRPIRRAALGDDESR